MYKFKPGEIARKKPLKHLFVIIVPPYMCTQSDKNFGYRNEARDEVTLVITEARDVCLAKKMLRFEEKLNRSDVLKVQPRSEFNEKENASNISAIKERNFVDLNLE